MRGFSYLDTFLLILTLDGILAAENDKIGGVLRHYETLHTDDIFFGIHKRDVSKQEKIVSFTTLNRHFRLHLTPHTEIFAENFHAYSIGEDNQKKEVRVEKENFYRGYDEGDPSSRASVHVDHGVLTASIATTDDTYIIEPAWGHIEEASMQHMISYRHSDVKSNITSPYRDPKKKSFSFCGHDSHHSHVLYTKDGKAPDMPSNRKRRAVQTRIRCRLALVADYRFYKEMAKGQERGREKTINYMIGVIDRVDAIFQNTEWSSEYKGYGFEIQTVKVHEVANSSFHYNMKTPDDKPWSIKTLLNAFSREKEWHEYCLAHLFTYQDFADGVIGLAYVGNPNANAVGGICTKKYFTNNMYLYLNTGLSSSINWGRKLLTEEADIVTAHEIGHNFGSEHDPDTTECAPAESDGGKYIMYPASVSGQWKNNKLFSPCSKRRIVNVLMSKSDCFREPRTEICGNYKKEKDEECDPGGIIAQETACCTSDCKLKPKALCSDGYDSPCCVNCLYTNTTSIRCRDADPTNCKDYTYCDGMKPQCPAAPSMRDGTSCIDRGTCIGGECKPFCTAKDLKPCKCSKVEDACKVCCKGLDPYSICTPYINNETGTTMDILDGRSCQGEEAQGTCVKGICKKTTQDLVERFWSFLTSLDSDIVAQFMKDNLAGTVVVFSLLIWIPASCYVNRIDKRRDKRESLEAEWRDPRSTQLLRQPKPTSKGKFIYRQDSISRSSKADKPFKIKPKNIKTHRMPQLEYTVQRESNL